MSRGEENTAHKAVLFIRFYGISNFKYLLTQTSSQTDTTRPEPHPLCRLNARATIAQDRSLILHVRTPHKCLVVGHQGIEGPLPFHLLPQTAPVHVLCGEQCVDAAKAIENGRELCGRATKEGRCREHDHIRQDHLVHHAAHFVTPYAASVVVTGNTAAQGWIPLTLGLIFYPYVALHPMPHAQTSRPSRTRPVRLRTTPQYEIVHGASLLPRILPHRTTLPDPSASNDKQVARTRGYRTQRWSAFSTPMQSSLFLHVRGYHLTPVMPRARITRFGCRLGFLDHARGLP